MNLEDSKTNFFKALATYFMDFLETDFHKRRLPKRVIKLRDKNNLLIGTHLQKYELFNVNTRRIISEGFSDDESVLIEKGKHKTRIPTNIHKLINLQIDNLEFKNIEPIVEKISSQVKLNSELYSDSLDEATQKIQDEIREIFLVNFISEFLYTLEKPLADANLGDVDDFYLIEQELSEIFSQMISNLIDSQIARLLANQEVQIKMEITELLNVKDIQDAIKLYFSNLQIADLYSELFEMVRNQRILDKQDFYLYFMDISFRGSKYPIFYVPITLDYLTDSYHLNFEKQMYINKKALEFIVQEFNAEREIKGSLKTISERIIYLAQNSTSTKETIGSISRELIDFFSLEGNLDFKDEEKTLRGKDIQISSACYIALFDKSDEALINDYEEIIEALNGDDDSADLAQAFNKVLEDFLITNPVPVTPDIESEWDVTELSEKLVTPSPIPLNSEQLQILKALSNKKSKYLVVEGPPGTGKSHTITAIIFDAILNSKSVLVLSDKKEALDVVEKNITQTINKVRFDKNFQNPILRLGKSGNTYSQILSKSTITEIRTHSKAVSHDFKNIDESIKSQVNTLRDAINSEYEHFSDINISDIAEFLEVENEMHLIARDDLIYEEDEVVGWLDISTYLDLLRSDLLFLSNFKNHNVLNRIKNIINIENFNINSWVNLKDLDAFCEFLGICMIISQDLKKRPLFKKQEFFILNMTSEDRHKLVTLLREFARNRGFLFGYKFKQHILDDFNEEIRTKFKTNGLKASENIERLWEEIALFDLIAAEKSKILMNQSLKFDSFYSPNLNEITYNLIWDETFESQCKEIIEKTIQINPRMKKFKEMFPRTSERLSLNSLGDLDSVATNPLINLAEDVIALQLRYINLASKIKHKFKNLPNSEYATAKKQIEELVTTKATTYLDQKLINFYDYNKNDAETIRSIIQKKQKFPKNQFNILKNAFPCILSGIRDFADYIPLQFEMFDLLIIDEASQVSLAQAFPALLRSKQVLILGDRKQFSNVKSAQARSDTNIEYLNNLKVLFKSNVSNQPIQLEKLTKFNIKTSVLDFFEFISNYSTQLLKHFRGYKEIISYSNKFFYQNKLQVMKIRSKNINNVLQFTQINFDPTIENIKNTNIQEIDFIVKELKRLKESGSKLSVGIITPHTNQQKLLSETISKIPEKDFYYDHFNLKIMTFDTCQGEERDLIFYSMVANPVEDKLWGIFIKDLSKVDVEENGQIKAQRLNVGFSRAKESMHFVISKPVTEFSGSIGEALRHYLFQLEEAKKERDVSEVDPNSPMEREVLNWLYQTNLWRDEKDSIEIIPQFNLGTYLRQLDPTYDHPNYKVDFLLTYSSNKNGEQKIIIEYDGFSEHFNNNPLVDAHNFHHYMNEGDLYREKVLESYGYKFLRINKFNIGNDPIATLNERISHLLKKKDNVNSVATAVKRTVVDIQSGQMKECQKCGELKIISNFYDEKLKSQFGKVCIDCKKPRYSSRSSKSLPVTRNPNNCPKCGSELVKRSGPYGSFLGCSRFPNCNGIRRI